jgi:cytoskeleton protein RodZ
MIERASEFGASAAVPLVSVDNTNKTAGDILREAREAHGLHLDMVANALKVTPQKLAALENDDIDALPDPVFARALAASVCRALRIDPVPVLAKLPGAPRPALAAADRTISKSLKSAGPGSTGGASRQPSRALLIVVLLLLLGAGALFWLPQSALDQAGESIARLTAREPASESTPPPEARTDTAVEPAAAATQPGGAVLPPPAQPMVPSAPASLATVPSVATAAPAAKPVVPDGAEPPAASSAGDGVIVFVAREDSWVTVSEQGGKSLLRRTLKGGEIVGLDGKPPLSVVVGHASGVEVRVHGKPFDLSSLTRAGGVARFEVKP